MNSCSIKKLRAQKLFALVIFLIVVSSTVAQSAPVRKKNAPEPRSAKFKPLKGEEAAKIVGEIQDILEKVAAKINSVSGRATIENEFIREKNVKTFSFQMKKTGKLRLEFTSPDDIKGTIMVTDGKSFWNHIPAMKKTYKINLTKDKGDGRDKPLQKELGLLLALVTTPLEREAFWKKFEIIPMGSDKVDGKDCHVVEFREKSGRAKNKNEEGLFNQYLWIEKKTGLTLQIELLVFGSPELVKITEIKMNPKLDDSLFSFKDPSGK